MIGRATTQRQISFGCTKEFSEKIHNAAERAGKSLAAFIREVVEAEANKWRDDDNPKAETTDGVCR